MRCICSVLTLGSVKVSVGHRVGQYARGGSARVTARGAAPLAARAQDADIDPGVPSHLKPSPVYSYLLIETPVRGRMQPA